MTRITSPIEGLNETTAIGPLTLIFEDGVAEVDSEELNDGLKDYLKGAGYGVGSAKAKAPDTDVPQPPDPRKTGDEVVGTRIRDAAVDPRKGDFLAPTNAGEDNPHGTTVINPEIHASEGLRPVKAGPVHVDDPGAQDAAEKAHATAATDGTAVLLTEEEQELLGVDAHGRPTELDSEQLVGDPDDIDPEALTGAQGDPEDSEGTGTPASAPADAETDVSDLKGQALTDALKAAELPTTGSAEEKRARLAEHRKGA